MNPALDSRARFEATFGAPPHSYDLRRDAEIPEDYHYWEAQAAWEAWQAAIASMAAPEGWVLVPIKPTEPMIKAGVFHTTRDDDEEPYRARGQAMVIYMDMLNAGRTPKDPPIAALAAKE